MSLRVEVFTSGIWQLSSVILSERGRVWVIDPGYFPRELEVLADRSAEHGNVDAVVFTHGHWDHVIGWRSFPNAEVIGSPSLAAAVESGMPAAEKNLCDAREFDRRWYVERPIEWPTGISPFADGETRGVGGLRIQALNLTGHSADGLALVQAGLLIAGDHLSPLEIPFVEDFLAYRATLARLLALLPEVNTVIPGHGPRLDRRTADRIARADLEYLDRLADAAGHEEKALAVPLPRADGVPGMREHHVENVGKARAALGAALSQQRPV